MNARKFIVGLLALTAAMFVLIGCATGGVAPTSAPPPAANPTAAPAATNAPAATTGAQATTAPGGAVTVVHWQHDFAPRKKIVEELVTEFKAQNPNITIDFQSIPYNDFFQKLGPSLEAGTGPDVFQIPGPLVAEFYSRGQLAPVPDSVYTGADIEKEFVPWTVQLLKQEGKYVGLPTDVQSFVIFYNDDLFKEAGLDPTKDLETYDEFAAAAEKLTKRDGDTLTQSGFNIAHDIYQLFWPQMSTLSDKGIVDEDTLKVTYDTDQGVATWKWMTDFVTKLKLDSPEFLAKQEPFKLGKSAMDAHELVYAGDLKLSAPDIKWSIHLPPHAPGRPAGTGGTHWAYVVSSKSKNPEAAWQWVKFLTSDAADRKWTAGLSELPSRTALYTDPAMLADPVVAKALEIAKVTHPFDAFGWDDVYAIHQGIWDNIVLKGQDVKTAVHDAAVAEEKLYQDKKIKPAQ